MADTPRTAQDWLVAYAAAIGIEAPDEETITQLLDLAGVAAHASERIAAPVACWMTAQAGLAAGDALAIARTI